MPPNNPEPLNNPLEFLEDSRAQGLFAKIDQALKDGYHIQNRTAWTEHWRFLDEHKNSINEYYQAYFGVKLSYAGSGGDRYYYLEFFPGTRGEIKSTHYQHLEAEGVVVAFLLYKVVFIDKNITLSSVAEFKRILRSDYETLKPDIIRTLAKVKYGRPTKTSDETINSAVDRALKDFEKLGWVERNDDDFEVLPAFQRIITIYSDIINNVDDWFKDSK